jgi:uncharacterized protein
MLSKTAILVFCRTPEKEACFKKISPTLNKNIALCKSLYDKTLRTASKTSLPIILCTEEAQTGNNFSEKITNAIRLGFGNGYENLIVIGNDCPNLTKNHLNAAYTELLQGKDIVAGQDFRGGIYLLGLNKKAFNQTSFVQFKWQTRSIFKEVVTYSSPYNFIKLASVLFDVNCKEDALKSLCLYKINVSWKILLIKFFNVLQNPLLRYSTSITSPILVYTQILRGPPSFIRS